MYFTIVGLKNIVRYAEALLKSYSYTLKAYFVSAICIVG